MMRVLACVSACVKARCICRPDDLVPPWMIVHGLGDRANETAANIRGATRKKQCCERAARCDPRRRAAVVTSPFHPRAGPREHELSGSSHTVLCELQGSSCRAQHPLLIWVTPRCKAPGTHPDILSPVSVWGHDCTPACCVCGTRWRVSVVSLSIAPTFARSAALCVDDCWMLSGRVVEREAAITLTFQAELKEGGGAEAAL